MKINWGTGGTRPRASIHLLTRFESWHCLALGGSSKASLEDHFGGQVDVSGGRKGATLSAPGPFLGTGVSLFQLIDWTSVFPGALWASAAGRALSAFFSLDLHFVALRGHFYSSVPYLPTMSRLPWFGPCFPTLQTLLWPLPRSVAVSKHRG